MNEELYLEKHKSLEDKVNTQEKRINAHSEKLDKLEQNDARMITQIENLCKQLEGLTAVLKWFIGLLVGSFIAFFFYAIEHNIFS
jgi:uncharacterized protein YlxW (UPF0749 family)